MKMLVSLHFNAFLDYPVEPTDTLFIQNTAEKENINAEMMCQNCNQAPYTERIFCAFSRGTSISIALDSHKRESDISHINLCVWFSVLCI